MVIHEVKIHDEKLMIREYAVTWLVVFPESEKKLKLPKSTYSNCNDVIKYLNDNIKNTK